MSWSVASILRDLDVLPCVASIRKNSVHSVPRRLLNPRRPKRKPTSEEAEEMLLQYDPVLPDDGRLVLSHYYEVRLRCVAFPYLAID